MGRHPEVGDGVVTKQAVTKRTAPPPPWHPLAWADALTQFGRTEIAGGLVLAAALAAALVWANASPSSYAAVWSHLVHPHSSLLPGTFDSVADVIDNGLMTIFFLAVGLEIGREVAEGSLRDRRNALLPVLAALGGMAGAALIYLVMAVALRPPGGIAKGWGIPMATDVAFTLGAIALLGRRVPQPLRIFILALAVADDVASVVVLALVGSTTFHPLWIVGALAALFVVWVLRRWVHHHWWPYALLGVVVWYCFVRGGVEPTLAGAFVGILVPVAGGARAATTLEQPVHVFSSYVVLPLFIVANAGVVLTGAVWHSPGGVAVVAAVVAARAVGKSLGITVAVLVCVRCGLSNLPARDDLAPPDRGQPALRHGAHGVPPLRPCGVRHVPPVVLGCTDRSPPGHARRRSVRRCPPAHRPTAPCAGRDVPWSGSRYGPGGGQTAGDRSHQ